MGFSRQESWSGVPLPSLKLGLDLEYLKNKGLEHTEQGKYIQKEVREDSDGQRNLVWCNLWGCKESDTT